MSNTALGADTLRVIILLSCAKSRWLCLSSAVVGIVVGYIAARLSGQFHLRSLSDTLFRLPTLFPLGFQFNSAIPLPTALTSPVCILEVVGDLTANSLTSQQSINDHALHNRLKDGILTGGISCMVTAMLCAFPGTTFVQNSGVVQMTGVASRYVEHYIGVILILLGLFPPVDGLLQQIPVPVLGDATMMVFDCIAAAGIRIITQTLLSCRNVLTAGLAFGVGLGVEPVPAFLSHFPPIVGNLFGSVATGGGLVAIAPNLILPQEQAVTKTIRSQDDRAELVQRLE